MTQELINTDSEEHIDNVVEKRPRGRPINPARHLPDGRYNKEPLDPEYYKKYYHIRYCEKYTCGICGKTLANSQKVKSHEKSTFCLKAKQKLENMFL